MPVVLEVVVVVLTAVGAVGLFVGIVLDYLGR